MAVDTPAVIAIVGAGPIGLEAALYARYLGYDVRVYERGRVVERLQQATHAGPGTPWGSSTSPLGVAAICAQRPDWRPPTADAILASGELAATYFLPLADSDLLADCVLVGTEVLSIERDASPGDQTIAEDEVPGFRLRVCDAASERVDTADVVIDASARVLQHFVSRGDPAGPAAHSPAAPIKRSEFPRRGQIAIRDDYSPRTWISTSWGPRAHRREPVPVFRGARPDSRLVHYHRRPSDARSVRGDQRGAMIAVI